MTSVSEVDGKLAQESDEFELYTNIRYPMIKGYCINTVSHFLPAKV